MGNTISCICQIGLRGHINMSDQKIRLEFRKAPQSCNPFQHLNKDKHL